MSNLKTAWIAAPLVVLGLMAFGAVLDRPLADEQAQADAAADAVTAARDASEQDIREHRFCANWLGAGAIALRTHQGDLVCRPADFVQKGGTQ